MKGKYDKVLRSLNLTVVSKNKHIKCKDKEGKIYIFSRDYLNQARDNPRFAKLTNKTTWLKNKGEIK